MPTTRSAAKRAAQASEILKVTPRPLPKLLFGHPPELANMIFRDVDPIDLLNLATVSKASRALVQSLSIKVYSIDVRYHSARAVIAIKTAKDKEFYFRIITSRKLVEKSRRDGTIRRIGNCEFTMDYSGERFGEKDYTLRCSNKDQVARMLARFFFGIYRTENVSFCIYSPRKGFMMYFIKNITTRFSNINIGPEVKLTEEEFRVVMEDISVNVHFFIENTREYNYERPFQHRKMTMYMPLKLKSLFGMRCEEIYLFKREFSVEDLKAFAQNWKEGVGMHQLKQVLFEYKGDYSTAIEAKDQVWTSLESLGFTSQAPQLPRPRRMMSSEPENVLYIQREDGRVASFQFFAYIWGMWRYIFWGWH